MPDAAVATPVTPVAPVAKPARPSNIDAALEANAARQAKPIEPAKSGKAPGVVPITAESELPYKPGARVKVKVDGTEQEVPIEDVLRDYQIRKASDQRFQEAAKMQQRVQQWVDDFNRDPIAAMEKLASGKEGAKFDEIVEKYLYNKMQLEKMTPEQRQAMQQKQELDRLRGAEAKRGQDAEEQKANEQKAQLAKRIQGQISTAMEAEELPADPDVAADIARLLLQAHRVGNKDYTARDAARDIRAKLIDRQHVLISKMTPEQLVKWIGKDAERIRQYEVSQLRNPPPTVVNRGGTRPLGQKTPPAQKPVHRYMTSREWEEKFK